MSQDACETGSGDQLTASARHGRNSEKTGGTQTKPKTRKSFTIDNKARQ